MQACDVSCVADLVGSRFNALQSTNQRAYADYLEQHACGLVKDAYPDLYKASTSVRSPEDFMLGDILVDVKTRCIGREFSMPNLISVDRASKILADPSRDIWYWFIDYEVHDDGTFTVVSSELTPIWHLNWQALSIQNLGLGQIQISNWSMLIDPAPARSFWMLNLTKRTREFYVRLQQKLEKRIKALG
jgi:hypothetical protein